MTTPPYDGATAPAAASFWGGKQEGFVMDYRLVLAPARPVARSFAAAAATTMLAALLGTSALAQTPPAPKGPAPAPKAAPKAAPKPAETPAPQAQQAAPPAQQGEQPQLIFSPWTKFCLKG